MQFSGDGLERWPLLQWCSYSSSVYNSNFTKCFPRGQERNYSSHGIRFSWVWKLHINTRNVKYISVFVTFPDRQLLQLPWDVPKGRMSWPHKGEQLKKQLMYCKWEKMKVNKAISLTKWPTLQESLKLISQHCTNQWELELPLNLFFSPWLKTPTKEIQWNLSHKN